MDWAEYLRNRARSRPRRMVFSQGEDARAIEAAAKLVAGGIAKPVLVGRAEAIEAAAKKLDAELAGVSVMDPATNARRGVYAQILLERQRARGTTQEEARRAARDAATFALLMVAARDADGAITGGARTRGEAARAAETILGLASQRRVLSSCALALLAEESAGGEHGAVVVGDAGANPQSSAADLAEIALATAETARLLLEAEPRVALLCDSTRDVHAAHVERVHEARRIVKSRAPEMRLSEASQGAAALAAGANVLIFPDADWDNLAYGLDEKWARAHFAGPIFQGLAGTANDASHGATADELVTLAAITAIQAASEALAASA